MTGIRRVFWVPNEIGDALQSGYRRAFADLVRLGLLDEVAVFSLERRMRAGGAAAGHRADLVAAVRRFRPDLLLLQHLGWTGLGERELAAMLGDPRPVVVYQEADPYTRWVHPLPRTARLAGAAADVVHTCGAGVFTANFRRAGARRVEWMPHTFDPGRIAAFRAEPERPADVSVVANRSRARVRELPSAPDRRRFVGLLQQRWGDRLALYGRGWSGPGARGPVPYSQQSAAIRSGWVSANWDHFASEPCYFSDRLPISLATGSLHATTLHPGHAAFFPPSTERFLITAATPEELVARIARRLASTSIDERIEAETLARRWAFDTLRQDDHLVTMLNSAGAGIDPVSTREGWDLATAPLVGG